MKISILWQLMEKLEVAKDRAAIDYDPHVKVAHKLQQTMTTGILSNRNRKMISNNCIKQIFFTKKFILVRHKTPWEKTWKR